MSGSSPLLKVMMAIIRVSGMERAMAVTQATGGTTMKTVRCWAETRPRRRLSRKEIPPMMRVSMRVMTKIELMSW